MLLDPADPTAALARAESSFFRSESSLETRGQTDNVCFLEGFVFVQGR